MADKGDKARVRIRRVRLERPLTGEEGRDAIRQEYRYGYLGMAIGAVGMVAGIALAVLGYTGTVDIAFESGPAKGHIVTGSLGIAIIVLSIILIRMTRPDVRG